MKIARLNAALVLGLTFALAGCSAGASDDPSDDGSEDALTKAPSTKSLVSGNTEFATDLYGELAQGNDNVFFSPYSVSAALSMTYAGAKTGTAAAMKGTLHLPSGDVHKAWKSLAAELAKRNDVSGASEGDAFQLSMANALFGEKTQSFKSTFTGTVKANYGAGLELADFLHKADAERQRINGWVETETHDKIKNLLPQGIITADTKLVLVNAIYFKASWDKAFKTANTSKEKFTTKSGAKVDADMMYETEHLDYAAGSDYEAVAVPYLGKDVELLAIAPKAGKFASFESSFDAQKLNEIRQGMASARVNLGLPKFKIAGASVKLKDALGKLGMGVAFSDDADLSGITGKSDTKIADVVHKAFIGVDEKGTEAAAATTVVIVAKSAMPKPPVNLTLDRPFIFAIRDIPTGTILFLGRVTDPS